MSQGMRMDFFLESPFMPSRMKLDRETLGGLADMFGQMPGTSASLRSGCLTSVQASVIQMCVCVCAQVVGSELARGSSRTGTRPRWDAIAPTRSSTATVATSPPHRSPSSTWGQSPSLSPTRSVNVFHLNHVLNVFFVFNVEMTDQTLKALRGHYNKVMNIIKVMSLLCPVCVRWQVQNQHFLNQNQNHLTQQQVQSKDMPPRFSKKGQLNADEVACPGPSVSSCCCVSAQ